MVFQSVFPLSFYILTSHSHEEIIDHFVLIIRVTVNGSGAKRNNILLFNLSCQLTLNAAGSFSACLYIKYLNGITEIVERLQI